VRVWQLIGANVSHLKAVDKVELGMSKVRVSDVYEAKKMTSV
jgi:hypothetical protein